MGSPTPLPGLSGQSGAPEVGSGLPSPPSSPPLTALTSTNELTLAPKINSRKRDIDGQRMGRREGAAYTIREECERLFCETMTNVFLGERDASIMAPSVMGTNAYSPPDESVTAYNYSSNRKSNQVNSWLEVWDYAGGCSFRGYVAGTGTEKCLFAFFDSSIVGRDLKQGLMALIELADTVFECSQVVICLDRDTDPEDSAALMKSLRWVGFELVTLGMWAGHKSVTSDKWVFLGMEL